MQPKVPASGVELSSHIATLCTQLGFAAVGFAPAQPSNYGPHFRQWLEQKCNGEMDFLERDIEVRENPARILEGTNSFLVVADQYAPRGSQLPSRLHEPRPLGRVARYAQGRDYHTVMKRRLHSLADRLRCEVPGSEFRTCVDTAPIFERELAALAGIGWHAKNTMLIHPQLGSYILLGVVATTLHLAPLASQIEQPDRCGTCTRCIDACPTAAITPQRIDASRCISYLTIEHRSAIPAQFHGAMGDWVYGCDICQEVCPHNSARPGEAPSPILDAYTPRTQHLDLLEVLAWTAAERSAAFKTSPMKRATLAMMQRNATIALANREARGE